MSGSCNHVATRRSTSSLLPHLNSPRTSFLNLTINQSLCSLAINVSCGQRHHYYLLCPSPRALLQGILHGPSHVSVAAPVDDVADPAPPATVSQRRLNSIYRHGDLMEFLAQSRVAWPLVWGAAFLLLWPDTAGLVTVSTQGTRISAWIVVICAGDDAIRACSRPFGTIVTVKWLPAD